MNRNSARSKMVAKNKVVQKKRSEPPCVHWKECGGCPLITKTYPEQLQHKTAKVRGAFLQLGFDDKLLSRVLKPTKASPQTLGYRNKAKWILHQESPQELKMGIYEPGTHDVVDIPHCAVHAAPINEVSMFVKQKLLEFGVPCGSDSLGSARVRYVISRYSFREKKLLLVFVTTQSQVPGLDRVVDAVDAQFSDRVASMVQNINDDQGNVLLGEANRYLKRKSELTETMGNFRVPVGPLSFLQVNSGQAAHLYRRVKDLIGKGPFDLGLDLYSGVGLIAMHLASTTQKILAVEEVGPAALEAITAARRNRLTNILNLCADAYEGIQTFLGEWGAPDWIVLNPPRKGCDETVLEAIVSRPPERLVYVSCNPVTLARDLAFLMEKHSGFRLQSLEPVDMFPQTEHIECIALLVNTTFSKTTEEVSTSSASPKKSKTRPVH